MRRRSIKRRLDKTDEQLDRIELKVAESDQRQRQMGDALWKLGAAYERLEDLMEAIAKEPQDEP